MIHKDEKKVIFQVNSLFGLLSFSDAIYNLACLPFIVLILKDVSKANLIISLLWVSMTIFEIPTGILTDRWGGKKTLVIYLITKFFALGLIVLGLQKIEFLYAGFLLLGFGLTFLTGCFSLQLKQLEHKYGLNLDYGKALSQGLKYKNTLSIAAILLGGLIIKLWGLVSLWGLLIVLCFIELTAVYFYWDNIQSSVKEDLKYFFSKGFLFIKNSKEFRSLMILEMILIISTLSLVTNGIVLLAPSLDKSPTHLTVYTLLIFGVKGGASFLFERWPFKRSFFPILILGFFMSLFWFDLTILKVIALVGSFFAYTQVDTFLKGNSLDLVPHEISSTVLSLQSFFENIVGALGYYLLSVYLRSFPLNSSLYIMSIPLLALSIYILFVQKKETVRVPPI